MSGLHRVRCSAACHRVIHSLQPSLCRVPRQQRLFKSTAPLMPHGKLAPFPFAFQLSDELLMADLKGKACSWVSQVAAKAEPHHPHGVCRCRPYGARGSPCVTADFRLGTWIASPPFQPPCLPPAPPAGSKYGAGTSACHYPWKGVFVGHARTSDRHALNSDSRS